MYELYEKKLSFEYNIIRKLHLGNLFKTLTSVNAYNIELHFKELTSISMANLS